MMVLDRILEKLFFFFPTEDKGKGPFLTSFISKVIEYSVITSLSDFLRLNQAPYCNRFAFYYYWHF